MSIVGILAAGAAATLIFASSAAAHDVDATPAYGAAALASGFSPDPYVVAVDLSAASVSAPCGGLVRDRPDFKLNYTGGATALIISTASSADTTLLVSGPDRTWYCDDNGGEASANPSVRFENAQSGVYTIWVGRKGAAAATELTISGTITR